MGATDPVVNKVLNVPATSTAPHGAAFLRAPMCPRDYTKSGPIASWLSPTGQQRSLPTNIRDKPASVNVNTIRSHRCEHIVLIASGCHDQAPSLLSSSPYYCQIKFLPVVLFIVVNC
jgi:hypothetical protein